MSSLLRLVAAPSRHAPDGAAPSENPHAHAAEVDRMYLYLAELRRQDPALLLVLARLIESLTKPTS